MTPYEPRQEKTCFKGRVYMYLGYLSQSVYEPRHDKTNKMAVCPAKTQISLGIRVFAVRMKKHWVLSYALSAQRRL